MKQNSQTKQQALRIEPDTTAQHAESVLEQESVAAASPETKNSAPAEELDERILAAIEAASDKKALDIVALDLRSIASFTDYFIITSGTNTRQVQAIADAVVDRLKKHGTRAARVEGYNAAEWVLVDYGDFVVHVFEDKARHFYDLERLWRDASRVTVPHDDAGQGEAAGGDALRSE